MVLALLLGAGLWVVATFLLDDAFRWILPDNTEFMYDALGKFNHGLVRTISSFLFGLEKEKVESVSEHETIEQEWTGQMNYMEHVVSDLVNDVKRDLKAEILDLKTVRLNWTVKHLMRFQSKALCSYWRSCVVLVCDFAGNSKGSALSSLRFCGW